VGSSLLTLDNQGVRPELIFRGPSHGDLAVVGWQVKLAGRAARGVELFAVLAGHGERVSQPLVKVKTERMANGAEHLRHGGGHGWAIDRVTGQHTFDLNGLHVFAYDAHIKIAALPVDSFKYSHPRLLSNRQRTEQLAIGREQEKI